MLSAIVLILSVALDCESGQPMGQAPVEPESAFGTGPRAVDPSRDAARTVDPSRESLRCVNPLRSETPPQVIQAPYKPHVQPKPPPAPTPQPLPSKPGGRLKLK